MTFSALTPTIFSHNLPAATSCNPGHVHVSVPDARISRCLVRGGRRKARECNCVVGNAIGLSDEEHHCKAPESGA